MEIEKRMWCSPITGAIFYGGVNVKTGIAAKNKVDVTDYAVRAVAEKLFYQPDVIRFTLIDGRILSLKSSVSESEIAENSVESAAYDLLNAAQRLVSQFYAAGIEPKKESLHPSEELLFQAEQAIAKALNQQ